MNTNVAVIVGFHDRSSLVNGFRLQLKCKKYRM
jgi:hypothetical protein